MELSRVPPLNRQQLNVKPRKSGRFYGDEIIVGHPLPTSPEDGGGEDETVTPFFSLPRLRGRAGVGVRLKTAAGCA